MAHIGSSISEAKEILDRGELIGLPTETVYGLAGNALNPASVSKIFQVKNRPQFDPLIYIVHQLSKLKNWFPSSLIRH